MAKIRVYELAREFGLENKEVLALCEELGIGVKSHSSGMEEAQADRLRRKVDREGLRREPAEAAEEPVEEQPAGVADAPEVPEPTAATVEVPPEEETKAGPGRDTSGRVVTSRPASEQPDLDAPAGVRPAPAREEPAPAPKPRPAPAPPPAERPAAKAEPTPAPAADVTTDVEADADVEADEAAEAPTIGPDGEPIPAPPPPKSVSGKQIPPPPGLGGRRSAPPRRAPGARPSGGRPSGGGGAGAGAGAGAGRPAGGGPPRTLPRGQVPGAGGKGGRPGGPRRPRRGRRRRRNLEELEPTQATSYTPSDAPVPQDEIVIERGSTAQDLGPKVNRSAADVVRFLMQQGEMVTATQSLADDMIELFAAEIGADIRLVDPGEEQEVELQQMLDVAALEADEEEVEDLPLRPPVITVMGHVDHGKTLLLDRIRQTNVVEGEAGGITQHVGAYQVDHDGRRITFIDTPGHEAFTAMRARGADVTDIVVLVVAADDGVMPQTVEAINHAKAADVPIVVAINKIDRDNANVDRVKQQLAEHDLVPEDWGGDTICVEISALQDLNVDDLLDNLIVVAEVEDLRAAPDGRAMGVVLESHLDVGRGPVATVLVQQGTLRRGDPMVAGAAWGRVRALIDDHTDQVEQAGPSTPVQVLGLSDVAEAGDEFIVAPDDRTARTVGEAREQIERRVGLASSASATHGGARLEDIFDQIQAGEAATLNLILKADVTGSLEALTESLKKLERDEVSLGFVHRAVGGINENDIQLAAASNATLIGFNVRPDRNAREQAEAAEVEIRTYEVIYEVLSDIENAIVGMLEPEYEEVVTGEAEVREIFQVPRVGKVAGCYVQHGTITRGSKVRFLREGTIIWKGEISSLKRFKEDVREVQAGFECGIGLSDFQDLKEGDVIETFEEREIART